MRQENRLRGILAVLAVGLMVALATGLQCSEILFPEIAAIAVGGIAAPRRAWQVSKGRMILCIALCALLGVAVVRWIPLPKFAQMWLAYAGAQGLLAVSGTGFAPMISAAVLPVMLSTETMLYPLWAVILVCLLALLILVSEKSGWKEAEKFCPVPLPERRDRRDMRIRLLAVGAVLLAVVHTGMAPFMAAPPLLVAFTEFSKRSCPARNHRTKAVLLIGGAACIGAAGRWLLALHLSIPEAAAAMPVMAGVLWMMKRLEMYLPPAGALAILPFLLKPEQLRWYPLQILLGAALYMLLACSLFRNDACSEKAAS